MPDSEAAPMRFLTDVRRPIHQILWYISQKAKREDVHQRYGQESSCNSKNSFIRVKNKLPFAKVYSSSCCIISRHCHWLLICVAGKHKPDADTRNEDEDAENESDSKGEESEQDEEIDDKEKESDDNSSDQPEVNGHSNNSSQSGQIIINLQNKMTLDSQPRWVHE